MIKILRGGRGGDIFKTPSPLRTAFAFTHPHPHPHHPTSSIFHCYPLPILHPSPQTDFDHTQTHKPLILAHPYG